MYKIISTENNAVGLTEKPTYIKIAASGSYVLCSEAEATGIAHNGKPYHMLDRDAMDGLETVFLLEVDMGNELAATNKAVVDSTKMAGQMEAAAKVFVQAATNLDDAVALQMPGLFKTWEEVLEAGAEIAANTIISCGDKLYRVVQNVTPQSHQRPDGDGMLAVYRPIDQTHAGTKADPIPFIYGMDTVAEKYYSYNGKVYLCKLTMPACVYAPDTPGLWQWEEVTDNA